MTILRHCAVRGLVKFGIAVLHLHTACGQTADTSVAPEGATVAKPQPIPGTYQILEQRKVQRDGRTMTYNRITPPQMPSVTPPAADTAEAPALAASRNGKAHGQLLVGATVFNDGVTEIHWTTSATGKRHVAYSNIDFNLIAGLGAFETVDTVYSMILAIGNATRADARDCLTPARTEFPVDLSIYFVPADDTFTEADNATLNALDALHAYYDANRTALQQAYVEREAKRLAREQWNREHPPAPKDEVLYIWKKQPSPTGQQGGNPP